MKDKRWDKIITERPRGGGTRQDSTQKVRARDHSLMALEKFENLAKMERLNPGGPMNYFDIHSKRFSDLITPLKAWLDKQVGRPWDKVMSDIHGMVNTKKVTGRHVMDHVKQWVKTNVEIDGKNVVDLGKYYWKATREARYLRPGELYVHPVDGLLKVVRKGKPKKKKEVEVKEILVEGHKYRKISGIWYEEISHVTTHKEPVKRRIGDTNQYETIDWRQVEMTTKHLYQLSTKKLKQLKISNDKQELE